MKENLIANKNPNFNLNTTKRFIEVMNDSQTIFKIQQDGGLKSTYQKDNNQLLKWIAQNNLNEKYVFSIYFRFNKCMHRMLNETKLIE